jgi:hypothetical protein
MGQIAHLNVGYIPWFFKDSNCLKPKVQCNLQEKMTKLQMGF